MNKMGEIMNTIDIAFYGIFFSGIIFVFICIFILKKYLKIGIFMILILLINIACCIIYLETECTQEQYDMITQYVRVFPNISDEIFECLSVNNNKISKAQLLHIEGIYRERLAFSKEIEKKEKAKEITYLISRGEYLKSN